jgi:hypothetical protein
MSYIVLIFSKDRALQLDATLRSFLFHCKDATKIILKILYTTRNALHKKQYEELDREYNYVEFIKETDFRENVLSLLPSYKYVFFLTDDNIFIKDFLLFEVIESLQRHTDALGFSLRLGMNSTYCYPLDKNQTLPEFQVLEKDILKFNWTTAEYDFGYPLEVSSSVYGVEDILPFIARLPFQNPNTLEVFMEKNKYLFRNKKPLLLCYKQSITFCAPINIVQTAWPNRASGKMEYTVDNLANLFEKGYRTDISAYSDFIPNACHQEIELKFIEPARECKA